MPHKRSTTKVWLIPIALFSLFVATSEAQPIFRWTEREQKDREDSITSGIRNLENMRREIVESSIKGPDINSRDLSAVKERRTNSDSSRYSAATAGTKGEHSLAVKPREVRQPRRQVDSAMYEALSRLANVQIADPRLRDYSRGATSEDRSAARFASNPNFEYTVKNDVYEGTREAVTNFGVGRTLKDEATTQKTTTASIKLQFAPRKFHCHPIREIYIPNVEKKMPAYACSLGRRAFVISSERFVQDSRDHFEVNVDESTYRRLTPMTSGMTTLTSAVSVLPATLVLRQGEDGYSVRGVETNWKEAQETADGDN